MIICLISTLILLVNLFNYQYGLNSVVFLLIHIIIFGSYLIFYKKKRNFIKLVELLIVSWPISWINIFGSATKTLQLPWFYIFGLIIFAYLLFLNVKNMTKIRGSKFILLMYFLLFLYVSIPLIICNNLSNGLSDFIMIVFYLLIMFIAYISKNQINEKELHDLLLLFVFVNLICSVAIIFQYLMYHFFHQIYFKMNFSGSFKGYQTICSLLFEDTSCSTIMLGCGALIALIFGKEHRINYLISLIIMIGLAFTARRTSLLSLIIILIPYFLIEYKGLLSKIIFFFVFPVLAFGMLFFLNLSRPVNNSSDFLNDNGRFVDYVSGINVALQNPIGIGYGDLYLGSQMNSGIIPHNTFLRWTDFGGLFLSIPLVIIFTNILLIARRKKSKVLFYSLGYVYLAANFIPDIFNGRFLIILFILVLLSAGDNMVKKGENVI